MSNAVVNVEQRAPRSPIWFGDTSSITPITFQYLRLRSHHSW